MAEDGGENWKYFQDCALTCDFAYLYRYTKADNSVVVTTDSIKNTTYIKAKENPVNPPELFASILGTHFLDTYAHIHKANVSVKLHRWTRMVVDGEPHPHSFLRDGEETRNVAAVITRDSIEIKSSIKGLTVLKSTGSAFHGYVQDEFTTLQETWDRILSTDVDCTWGWKTFANVAAVKESVPLFDKAWEAARNITIKTFANDDSASVQATMYKMAEQILEAAPEVATAAYSLPNKHYFEIDLSWYKDTKNTGADAEVYAPQSGPNGLIFCEVSR